MKQNKNRKLNSSKIDLNEQQQSKFKVRTIEKSHSLVPPHEKVTSKVSYTVKNLQKIEEEKNQKNDAQFYPEEYDSDPDPQVMENFSGSAIREKFKGTLFQKVMNKIDGSYYIGDYEQGKKQGKGKIVWPDGTFYIGDFENDQIHGRGQLITSDKKQYFGEWKFSQMDGKGVMIWPDGRKYEGEYKQGKKSGRGTYIWKDGKKYIGEWKEGKQHGNGIIISITNEKFQGVWNQGVLLDEKKTDLKDDGQRIKIDYDFCQKTTAERNKSTFTAF